MVVLHEALDELHEIGRSEATSSMEGFPWLTMHSYTPHSGVTNISDRFRLSVDHRVMRRGSRRPIIGEVVSIAPDRIELRDHNGVTALRIEPETYVRTEMHQRLHGQDIVELYRPGTKAIAAYDDGVVASLRPLPLSAQ